MKVFYPWLEDPLYENENKKYSKREFLKGIDDFLNQRQYVKITLLNMKEQPLKSISGEIVSGSMTKDGSSAVRRTCNLACTVNKYEIDIEDTKMDYSINKKVFIEVGVKNETKKYKDYPILWFPQGVFYISAISISSAANSAVNVSLTLKDKMAMLDGTIGGKLPTTVIFDEEDTQSFSGEFFTRKVKVSKIIFELMNHFAKEDINNIVIEDIPEQIGRIIMWNGKEPLCLIQDVDNTNSGFVSYDVVLESELENNQKPIKTWYQGDDIGYFYEDFVYDGELVGNAGATITSILDSIKNYLGNFEYFYDEYGIFHFREIKNYLNNARSNYAVNEMNEHDYLMSTASLGKNVYSFEDNSNLVSISINPNYENIKNDFIVHGTRKQSSKNIAQDIMYHLVIDRKPQINQNGYDNILVYKDKNTSNVTLTKPTIVSELPAFGEADTIYGILDENSEVNFELQYTQEKIEELGDYKILPDRPENISSEASDSENDAILSLKNLCNNIVFLTQYLIDSSLQKNGHEINLSEEIENYIKKITENNFYKNYIIEKKEISNILIYSIISQIEILKNYKNVNESIEKICNSFDALNITVNEIEKIEDDSNLKIKEIKQMIQTLEIQKSVCKQIADNYKKINGSHKDKISSLESEIIDIDKQIAWWQSRLNLQDINQLADEDIPIYTESHQIQETTFWYWNNGWFKVDWIKYYPESNTSNNQYYIYEYHDNYMSYEYWEDIKDTSLVNVNRIQKNSFLECRYIALDWRTEIILQGLQSYDGSGNDNNSPYFEELYANWPTIYNLDSQQFKGLEQDNDRHFKSLTDGNYFFDMIDSSSNIFGEFCVDNIGRRENVTISDDINCLFEPEIMPLGFIIDSFILKNLTLHKNLEEAKQELKDTLQQNNMYIVQIKDDRDDIYGNFATGGICNGAFQQIKYDLLIHTLYQKSINLTAIPVWYLEPNVRVSISDKTTNTISECMIQNLSYTFGSGNLMNAACSESLEKI